jgi:hypothetical protein
MDRTMSIGAAFALLIFPPACEMTLLVSELAFATRAMREAVEQGGSLPICLSICVQRAALKTPPLFGRALSFPESAARLSRGADSCPQASCGPLPQILSSRRGSGSRRHPRWAMYGPPPDCKRKVRMRRMVCDNVFGLLVKLSLLAIMYSAPCFSYQAFSGLAR